MTLTILRQHGVEGWETNLVELDGGGGGGGSLPAWWTVDSTPGSESVEFAGAVLVTPDAIPHDDPAVTALTINTPTGAGYAGAPSLLVNGDSEIDYDGNPFLVLDQGGFVMTEGAGQTSLMQINSVDHPTWGYTAQAGSLGILTDGTNPEDEAVFIQDQLGDGIVAAIFADGTLKTRAHAALPDLRLLAGDMTIWFDQTNGAAKLKIKAKQADGTVRTGEVALS